MKKVTRIKCVWVWALLALLLSYNFDLECFFEQHSCRTQVVHFEPAPDCTQPGIAPLVAALLPVTPVVTLPRPAVAVDVELEWPLPDVPWQACRLVPLGLRAPPIV